MTTTQKSSVTAYFDAAFALAEHLLRAGPTMVRLTNRTGGPCDQLGPFVCESGNRVVYRTRNGKAFVPKRLVHLEPCSSCHDQPRWLRR